MEAVLSTPELLEGILLAVDVVAILTKCQLVCRDWRDAVKTSPSLQRHLFFLGEPPAKASGPPRKNQLLEEKFGIMFGDAPEDGVASRASFECLALSKSREAFARPDATWRRMHISQPPTHNFSVVSLRAARGGLSYEAEQIPPPGAKTDVEHGLVEPAWRMADLYRYLWKYVTDNRISYFRVWWGRLSPDGVGLPGHEYGVRGDQKIELRAQLEKLFYDNNQVVLVTQFTVQCAKGLSEKDRAFRDSYCME